MLAGSGTVPLVLKFPASVKSTRSESKDVGVLKSPAPLPVPCVTSEVALKGVHPKFGPLKGVVFVFVVTVLERLSVTVVAVPSN
jgi:hypothetical protein